MRTSKMFQSACMLTTLLACLILASHTARDPITGEKYSARTITRYNEDDTRVLEMHRMGEDGKEWKVMEISYKRSKN